VLVVQSELDLLFQVAIFPINMVGNNTTDYRQAEVGLKKMLGYVPTKVGSNIVIDDIEYTWHHHEDRRHMMLVPTVLNSNAKHLGGARIVQKGIEKDSFDNPLISHSKINDLCQ
jgi:hypothetical protein